MKIYILLCLKLMKIFNILVKTLGGKEGNYCFSKRKQKLLYPLCEDEIYQLLKGYVTTQANAGLQRSHSQEGVSETSYTFENEQSLEIIFIDQKIDIIFFHEDDRVVMFDNPEECFVFKNELDYEFEEYEPERDNMLEIESQFLVLEEFTVNTQIAEGYTSLCLPINQQPIIILDQNKGSTCIFTVGSQEKVVLQDFQDPFGILLQALEKMNVVQFVSISLGFSCHCEFPTCTSFCLLGEN